MPDKTVSRLAHELAARALVSRVDACTFSATSFLENGQEITTYGTTPANAQENLALTLDTEIGGQVLSVQTF